MTRRRSNMYDKMYGEQRRDLSRLMCGYDNKLISNGCGFRRDESRLYYWLGDIFLTYTFVQGDTLTKSEQRRKPLVFVV